MRILHRTTLFLRLSRKILRWSDQESNPRWKAQRQGRNRLSYPITRPPSDLEQRSQDFSTYPKILVTRTIQMFTRSRNEGVKNMSPQDLCCKIPEPITAV